MKKIFTLLFLSSVWLSNAQTNFDPNNPSWATNLKGYWTFDDPANFGKATIGTDLVINNFSATTKFTQIAGPSATDKALHKPFQGCNMLCTTGIGANGGGTRTNQYSIMFDFSVPAFVTWNCLISTDVPLSNDGELYLSNGAIGGGATFGYYPADFLSIDTWYRCLFTVDLTQATPQTHLYINGVEKLAGANNYIIDHAKVSLGAQFYFLGDSDVEEDQINTALLAVFDRALTPSEATTLGSPVLGTAKFSANNNTLKVYPNPISSNSARISFVMPTASKNANIELIDMTGRVVENIYKGDLDQGEQTISWNLKNKYNAGTYIVKLTSEDTSQTFSVIMK